LLLCGRQTGSYATRQTGGHRDYINYHVAQNR
jgi:hypothetical protein